MGAAVAVGPGRVDLLDAIAHPGSISAAARQMGMSYRRAWVLVDTMNRCFVGDLVHTSTGGPGGGGARVTDLGREVVERYRTMEAKAASSVVEDMKGLTRLLRVDDEGPA